VRRDSQMDGAHCRAGWPSGSVVDFNKPYASEDKMHKTQ
jgi:hypothetical protein